jgi:uncharacterized protein (DUF885 family)
LSPLSTTPSIAKEFDGKASQYFEYLPRMRFAILPVPAAEVSFYTSARGGPGTYLINTYDLPSFGLYSLPALTLHESAPEHANGWVGDGEVSHFLQDLRHVGKKAYLRG